MKPVSIVLLFLVCKTVCSQEDPNSYFEDRINQYYENGIFDSVLFYSAKWYTYGQDKSNDSIMALSLRYYIEGCQKSKRYTEGSQALDRLLPFVYTRKNKSEFSRLHHATKFTYMFYKADFALAQKSVDTAKVIFHQMIKFVEDHPEYYIRFADHGIVSGIFDLAQARLNQVYINLGDCHMENKDYDNAYTAYVKSYEYAVETDSIFKTGFRENYGRTILALGKLMNFASVTKNDKLFEKWATLNSIPDDSRYRGLNNRSSSITYLAHTNDAILKSKNIIDQLKSSSLTKSDPTILLAIINYYLRKGENTLAIRELTNYEKRINPDRENINNKMDHYLASAMTSMIKGNWPMMQSNIEAIKKIIRDTDLTLLDGLNNSMLTANQTMAAIFTEAYTKNRNKHHLIEIIGIGNVILPYLQKLKYTYEQGEDNSIVLKQAYDFVIKVLDAFYILSNAGTVIDYSVLFQYFELNKSFNLQNERFLRAKLFTKTQLDRYNKLKLEIKTIEAEIKEDSKVNEQAMIHLGRLKANRKALVDSVPLPEIKPFTVKEVQDLLSDEEHLIEYVLNDNVLYTLYIEKNAVEFFKKIYPEGKDNLVKRILNYKELTVVSNQPGQDTLWSTVSYNLYSDIIKPFISKRLKKLIIVPDAHLNLISFQSLLTHPPLDNKYRQWPFLIKKYSISIQPSAKFWMESNYEDYINRFRNFYLFSPKMDDITYHKEECISLYQEFKHTSLINEYTNTTAILSGIAEGGNILHIATHAQSDPQYESRTFIRTSEDTLKASEIAYENFDHELVFLSACETGIGEVIKEEGVFSLARSFFKAGARSVISTLWKINDKVSKGQVLHIYQYLAKGYTKDEAIRQMQLDYLSDTDLPGKFAIPYYWAAYQCQGDLRPLTSLSNKGVFQKYVQWIVLGILILGLLINQVINKNGKIPK